MEGNFRDRFAWFRSDYFPVPFSLIGRQGLKDGGEHWEKSFRCETGDV